MHLPRRRLRHQPLTQPTLAPRLHAAKAPLVPHMEDTHHPRMSTPLDLQLHLGTRKCIPLPTLR
jgi:hypothetical protein